MMSSLLLYALLLTPLLVSVLCFIVRWTFAAPCKTVTLLHSVGIVLTALFAFGLIGCIMSGGPLLTLQNWVYVDSLGAVFVGIIGIIGLLAGSYSLGYMKHEVADGEVSEGMYASYYSFFHLFLFTMILAVTSNNIIMMWVAIEATTLSSAFLVGLYNQRSSMEAAWKYIIICTVGVAFGLYGTVLVYSNAVSVLADPASAIFWTVVHQHAAELDPTLIHMSFAFVLIGFGTKAGLFPMHAWLPDAHSEAPSPTSAMLSAVLLNCAMLIIIRYYIITVKAVGADYPQTLMLVFGLMSVAVAALFIIVQRDIKRLLAYSSVENMGLIAVAIGIGGPLGVLAALLHTINHSLAKTLLFCCSGNVLLKYGTRDMDAVKGMSKVAPITAVMFAGGALALGGMPPFNVFISEFMLVTAGIKAGQLWVIVLCLILLTIVLAGLVRMIAATVLGDAPEAVTPGELGKLTLWPIAVLLALMLLMGLHIPAPLFNLLNDAVGVVLDNAGQTPLSDLSLPWPLATTSWLNS
jgi:hydrogenase-4 component F